MTTAQAISRFYARSGDRFAKCYTARLAKKDFYDQSHLELRIPGTPVMRDIFSSSYHETGQTHVKINRRIVSPTVSHVMPLPQIEGRALFGDMGVPRCGLSWGSKPDLDAYPLYRAVDIDALDGKPWSIEAWGISPKRLNLIGLTLREIAAGHEIITHVVTRRTVPVLLVVAYTVLPEKWADFQPHIAGHPEALDTVVMGPRPLV